MSMRKNKKGLYALLSLLFWLVIWQLGALVVNQPLYMPSPAQTVQALGILVVKTDFWLSLVYTFYRVIVGLMLSFAIGIALAFLASLFSLLEHLFSPFMAAVKSTPVMSVIVLALVWFSSSAVPIFACVLLCLPIFYTNTLSGLRNVDKQLLEMAQVFGIKRLRVMTGITIPSVLPQVYAAIGVCLGFSWKSVVAAEVLSSPRYSLGFNLYATKLYLDTPGLFAWTLTIIVISLIVEKGLRRILPKGETL